MLLFYEQHFYTLNEQYGNVINYFLFYWHAITLPQGNRHKEPEYLRQVNQYAQYA